MLTLSFAGHDLKPTCQRASAWSANDQIGPQLSPAMILVRNHPGGDPTPSRADIEMTKRIVEIADRLGIVIHDHTITARNGHASLNSLKPI
jgi:hypothetical protein